MSLKIVVLSSRLEQLMISPKESCLLRFLSFFFFSLLLQIPTSPCRYAHVNVTFFFVFSFRLFLFQS